MINPDWRFWAPSGEISPGGPSKWYIFDTDQRRMIVVTMDGEQEEEEVAIEHLKRHVEDLDPGVFEIYVSDDGDLISTSSNPEDDRMEAVNYPLLSSFANPADVKTVRRQHMRELERLSPEVDLVEYTDPAMDEARPEKLVFKYICLSQSIVFRWDEMQISMHLPPHPNIVPLDRVVIEELEGRPVVIGFTTRFVPGGTVCDNIARVFKLKYLKQLIKVIDDLNLKYGIEHQDVAPRNLLVDEENDNLLLFDFNYSGPVGGRPRPNGGLRYEEVRNDVKGVIFTLYEIITQDAHFRRVQHAQQNSDDVYKLETWTQHPDVKLDHPVADYRSVLNEWVEARKTGPKITVYTEAPEYIEWPDLGQPPGDYVVNLGDLPVGHPLLTPMWRYERKSAWQAGMDVICWERPSQESIKEGIHILATGEVVEEDELSSVTEMKH
ncbi:hypothetical protein N8I77_012582 [Diaporthe amygdali]|uniref:EKC/KEOPS complex subunit BUD32 n=1 Tax=Phomopsis amygdali TaxID=1214568 RepID=A0AAD9S311_PHOAM|nr:hypothetical protein N8I77_012582 [Diaporthe amygdali]